MNKRMQVENARRPARAALIEALNHASREAGGLGTLFGEAVARRFGVSPSDLECIDMILRAARMTAGELAAASGLTTGAVTGVIDRLERAGYARRERDAADRRKVYVSILPRTRTLGMAYYGSLEKAINRLIEDYDDAEIALLTDFFSRSRDIILREIEKLSAKPAARKDRSRSPRP